MMPRTYLVGLSLGLLILLAGTVGIAAIFDLRSRSESPETVVRGYFQALEAGDAEGALDRVDPARREEWREFVENGVLNEYRIAGIAVRQPSLLARVRGESSAPRNVTVFLDITAWASGDRWQASPRTPLVQHEGRWYLSRPPLAAPDSQLNSSVAASVLVGAATKDELDAGALEAKLPADLVLEVAAV